MMRKQVVIGAMLAMAASLAMPAQAAAPAAPTVAATVAENAAPATAPDKAPASPTATATTATAITRTATSAPAAPAADRPKFDYARPVAGVGQPVSAGMDFQPQVTDNGNYAHWLNNAILLPLMAAICVLVLGLMLWISGRYRAKANAVPSKTTHNTLIEVIWTLLPVLMLVAIAVPSIDLLAKQYAPPPRDAVTIKVTGYQWNWGYEYPDHAIPEMISKMLPDAEAIANGEPIRLAVDQRMVVPVGRTIKLIVTGGDVIHSFAVPALWTKMDAVPGRLNEVTFKANQTGVYYGQCSELCGIDHSNMPIAVEVVTPERFALWVASQGGRMPGVPAAATPSSGPGTQTSPATAAAVTAPAQPSAPALSAPAAAPAPAAAR